MRLILVLLGVLMVLVGLFATFLGLLTWILFFGGIAVIGIGLMIDSREKAAAKARSAQMKRYRDHRNNRGY